MELKRVSQTIIRGDVRYGSSLMTFNSISFTVADPGESKILLSAGSPIITQLVDLFFDGEPFYFATNPKKSFCSVFLSQGLDPPPPPSKIPGSAPAFISR